MKQFEFESAGELPAMEARERGRSTPPLRMTGVVTFWFVVVTIVIARIYCFEPFDQPDRTGAEVHRQDAKIRIGNEVHSLKN